MRGRERSRSRWSSRLLPIIRERELDRQRDQRRGRRGRVCVVGQIALSFTNSWSRYWSDEVKRVTAAIPAAESVARL